MIAGPIPVSLVVLLPRVWLPLLLLDPNRGRLAGDCCNVEFMARCELPWRTRSGCQLVRRDSLLLLAGSLPLVGARHLRWIVLLVLAVLGGGVGPFPEVGGGLRWGSLALGLVRILARAHIVAGGRLAGDGLLLGLLLGLVGLLIAQECRVHVFEALDAVCEIVVLDFVDVRHLQDLVDVGQFFLHQPLFFVAAHLLLALLVKRLTLACGLTELELVFDSLQSLGQPG